MNIIQRVISAADKHQQTHRLSGFTYAIIRKYGDDQAGYLAALIAYYAFISLFPLLIVATSAIQILTKDNAALRDRFLENATSYFPGMQQTIVDSINTPSKSGVALLVALLVTFYGARGVALVIIHAQNHMWAVARPKRTGFPKSLLRGFGVLLWGGIGLVAAAALTGYAAASHPWPMRLLLGIGGYLVLTVTFWGIYTFASSARRHPASNVLGSMLAAAGLLVLQILGGYIISYQLRNQTGLSAQFALVLVMLFWLYLQAQVFLYAAELNVVRAYKLWPRAINPNPPLPADKKAYSLYRRREDMAIKR